MSEILSQSEIDKLLSELTSSDELDLEQIAKDTQETQVKQYDFKNPKRINKNQLKVLTSIFESFSRRLSSYLSGALRTFCEITVISTEELPYYEYNNALPDTMVTGIYNVEQMESPVLLNISNNISFILLDRMLGGNSRTDNINEREFTEIDISLLSKLLTQVSSFFDVSWHDFYETHTVLNVLETDTRMIQAKGVVEDEIVIIVSMNVTINSVVGSMTFCMACKDLKPLLDSISNNGTLKGDVDIEQMKIIRENLMKKLNRSVVDLRGLLGKAELSMGTLMSLQEGDVIKLESLVSDPVDIFVNGNKWFSGIPGEKNNSKAVKITKILRGKDSMS